MNCQRFRREIEERDAERAPSRDVQEHLRLCDACRKFDEERASLRRLLAGVERVAAPPDFDFKLRARMAAAGLTDHRRPRPPFWRFAPGFVALSIAAVFTLTLVALRFQQSQPVNTANLSQQPATKNESNGAAAPQIADSRAASVREAQNEVALTDERNAKTREAERAAATEATAKQQLASVTRYARYAQAREASTRTLRASRAASVAARSDFTAGVNGAGVLRGAGELARASVPVAVPVNSSAQPLKVLLRDEGGEARIVSIKSVSFGAQELVGRAARQARPALSSNEGVW